MQNKTPQYLKVQHGKRWLLCRPVIGNDNCYKTVATFDAECELDKLLGVTSEPMTAPLSAVAGD